VNTQQEGGPTLISITVHVDKCISSGNCVDVAPEAFDMDDDGLVIALVDSVPDDQKATIVQAAQACPVQAILLGE
jgi:ferredoxin